MVPKDSERFLINEVFSGQPASLYAPNSFDADFIFEPVVNYEVSADFTMSTTEACAGEEVILTNTSSPIFQSRFYNPKKFANYFNDTPDDTFTWTLADGSTVNTVDATTTTTDPGSKTITLNAGYKLWLSPVCANEIQQDITFIPVHDASFAYGSTATISVTGGTGPYTYSWLPDVGADASVSGLTAGTYTVTVTDINGCSVTQEFTIVQPMVILTNGIVYVKKEVIGSNRTGRTICPTVIG